MRDLMSQQEHQRAADLLDVISGRIAELLQVINDRKGLRVPIIDRVLKADRTLELVRSDLDSLMCSQHPAAYNTSVYYPPKPDARQAHGSVHQ